MKNVRLLAIDLGLRFGWAAYASSGKLVAYGSRHFGTRTSLKKAIPRILSGYPDLAALVVEGSADLATPWEKEALRLGMSVTRVSPERWRETIIKPSQRRTGKDAKAAADGLAREVIKKSKAKSPISLRHDAAEAILVGLWAVRSWRITFR